MRDFLFQNLAHVLALLILVGRIGDILTTYLVTPKLKLEANPVVKRLGWRFAASSVLLCLVPYYQPALGIIVLVPSLLVSASNAARIWAVRTYGEEAYSEFILGLARRSRLSQALVPHFVVIGFHSLVGLVMLFFCPDPSQDWGFWFALGFLTYAGAIGLHGALFYRRLFRKVRREAAAADR